MTNARSTGHFSGVDFEGFWDDGEWIGNDYTEPVPSDELIAEVEAELGFRLPDSYVELARMRNGGAVLRDSYPTETFVGWAEDHIAISSISAIGRTAQYSLLGKLGSTFMQSEWGYPRWGVCVADTPTAGHQMVMLDYRECGPQGEPSVVWVDQEGDYSVGLIAPDFATFIAGLVPEETFEDPDDPAHRLEDALLTVRHGTFSPIVQRALALTADTLPDAGPLIRGLGEEIVNAKGGFYLHADEASWLMYDTMFWLYCQLTTAGSFDDYFDMAEGQHNYEHPCHELMLRICFVDDRFGFNTGGFAKGFVEEWWEARLADGSIVEVTRDDGTPGFRFTPDYEAAVVTALRTRTP